MFCYCDQTPNSLHQWIFESKFQNLGKYLYMKQGHTKHQQLYRKKKKNSKTEDLK